jgi:transcriptional regulator with GAF, ATPase, and Fis domain
LLKRHRFLERRLRESQENQEIFLGASQNPVQGESVADVYERVMKLVHQRSGEAPCLLWLSGEDGFLRARHVRRYPTEMANGLRLDSHVGAVGQCLEKRVFREEQGPPVDFPGRFDEDNRPPFEARAAWHFPLIVDNEAMGVLSVLSESPAPIDFERRESLTSLLQYLSLAVKNARFHAETHSMNRRMRTEVLSTTRELTQTNLRLIRRSHRHVPVA